MKSVGALGVLKESLKVCWLSSPVTSQSSNAHAGLCWFITLIYDLHTVEAVMNPSQPFCTAQPLISVLLLFVKVTEVGAAGGVTAELQGQMVNQSPV